MEEELRAAVEARGEAERRLHEAAQENEKHARDMATMRATVAELR